MAAKSLNTIGGTPVTGALTAASNGGDSFPLPGGIVMVAKNTGAAAITITAVAQKACNFGVLHNGSFVIPNDSVTYEMRIAEGDVQRFQDVNGLIQLTYSVNPPTGLTIAAHV